MFLIALEARREASGSRAEMGVDPPDIPIGTAIDDIEAAVARIAEQKKLAGRDIKLHYSLPHRKFRHIGGTLRDDDRIEILGFFGIEFPRARDDVIRGSAPTHRFDAAVIVILEPALVAPELLFEMCRRLVVGLRSLSPLAVRLKHEAGCQMQRAVRRELRALLLQRNMGGDGSIE